MVQPLDSQFQNCNILVAEDTAAHRLIIKRAFRDSAQSVEFVTNGAEAIEYLEAKDPDIVLLDFNMPEYNGAEVIKAIKNGRKSPVFVVLTTSDNEADVRRAYDAGANAYMVKPFAKADFDQVVKDIERFWFNPNVKFPTRGEIHA